MVLDDKQRKIGRDNFDDAARVLTRRQMLSGVVAVPSAAAMYWQYSKLEGAPVKTGLIGTGNQGCYAHISQSNPDFIDIVAAADIRPSSRKRARRLFAEKYLDKASRVRIVEDYKELLEDPQIEMIIVALPLHLHAKVTMEALEAGKHVLCEKLMAKTVTQCKQMVRKARETKKFLAVGHQRHYSYLYANALRIIEEGLLGDIRHIRAYWHRNQIVHGDSWRPGLPLEDQAFYEGKEAILKKHGYDSLEQLIRWRIDNRTGGGLMVELGSHQLDAASIFLGHKLPKAVVGTGVLSYFDDGRDINDHVFLNYEFGEDANNTVVTYSSISTNTFDGYGEQVNGAKGTMIIQQERDAYVFQEPGGKDTRINWAEKGLSRPTTDSGSTASWAQGVGTADTLSSRGYREEQEHLAWLIRNVGQPDPNPDPHKPGRLPRCSGEVALNDAVVTLVSNIAMAKKERVEFKEAWFKYAEDDNPEDEYGIKTG